MGAHPTPPPSLKLWRSKKASEGTEGCFTPGPSITGFVLRITGVIEVRPQSVCRAVGCSMESCVDCFLFCAEVAFASSGVYLYPVVVVAARDKVGKPEALL